MYEYAAMEKERNGGSKISDIEHIKIDNLSFRFAGSNQFFSNLNLRIKKGEITAIVGESGTGKSTLGQILQGFYPYEQGNININNHTELSEVNLESYRRLIGVVPQEITIFSGNVIDNILLGEETSIENLENFIKKYQLDVFFSKFPQGLATILGEEGVNLSGGQKQMIALARVLYKNPQFLILDESTAAMDRKTERFYLDLLSIVKKNCCILFISHRLNTLRKYADKIYVLENKKITAEGSHKNLMETSNFYSDFWTETETNRLNFQE